MSDTPNTAPSADLPAPLTQQLEELASYRQAFKQSAAKHADLVEQIAHQERAAQAAEAEGEAAKLKLRQALRDAVGRPTKKLYELKADEKAAYSLAEEYRSLAYDLGTERDRVAIDMRVAAARYREELTRCRASVADGLLESALAAMPPELVEALRLQAAIQDYDPTSEWHQIPMSNSATAFEFVFDRASKRLLALLKSAPDNGPAMLPPELVSPLNAAGFVASPLELKKMRENLVERERTGYPLEA